MIDITTLDAELAASEAQVRGLRPGCHKRVIWADASGVKTQMALLYIHGFSASPEEIRPLPDLVAQSLGANIYFTRLTGHGQDGAAMAQASLADWQRDVSAAVAIAQMIGDEIILMGCSTGCTLATLALAQGVTARTVIHISPNFGLTDRRAQWLLDMPGSQYWGHLLAGSTRSFAPINAAHAANWTTQYPTQAVHPMGQAVRAVRRADLSAVQTPAYFAYNTADQVVRAKDTSAVMDRWGGPVQPDFLVQGPDDDASGHVMAGDVFSPRQTAPLAARIADWLKTV